MGLDLKACNKKKETTVLYHSGYTTFGFLRMEMANCFDQKYGALYKKSYMSGRNYQYTDEEEKWFDENEKRAPNFTKLLLWHSDCDGKLTHKDCNLILKDMSKINFDSIREELKPFYKQLLECLEHCAKHKRTLWFR